MAFQPDHLNVTRITQPQNAATTKAPATGGNTPAIVAGVVVPVLLIGVGLFAFYVWYRRKYPVRMVLGKDFSRFTNPMYNKRASTLTLVRSDGGQTWEQFEAQLTVEEGHGNEEEDSAPSETVVTVEKEEVDGEARVQIDNEGKENRDRAASSEIARPRPRKAALVSPDVTDGVRDSRAVGSFTGSEGNQGSNSIGSFTGSDGVQSSATPTSFTGSDGFEGRNVRGSFTGSEGVQGRGAQGSFRGSSVVQDTSRQGSFDEMAGFRDKESIGSFTGSEAGQSSRKVHEETAAKDRSQSFEDSFVVLDDEFNPRESESSHQDNDNEEEVKDNQAVTDLHLPAENVKGELTEQQFLPQEQQVSDDHHQGQIGTPGVETDQGRLLDTDTVVVDASMGESIEIINEDSLPLSDSLFYPSTVPDLNQDIALNSDAEQSTIDVVSGEGMRQLSQGSFVSEVTVGSQQAEQNDSGLETKVETDASLFETLGYVSDTPTTTGALPNSSQHDMASSEVARSPSNRSSSDSSSGSSSFDVIPADTSLVQPSSVIEESNDLNPATSYSSVGPSDDTLTTVTSSAEAEIHTQSDLERRLLNTMEKRDSLPDIQKTRENELFQIDSPPTPIVEFQNPFIFESENDEIVEPSAEELSTQEKAVHGSDTKDTVINVMPEAENSQTEKPFMEGSDDAISKLSESATAPSAETDNSNVEKIPSDGNLSTSSNPFSMNDVFDSQSTITSSEPLQLPDESSKDTMDVFDMQVNAIASDAAKGVDQSTALPARSSPEGSEDLTSETTLPGPATVDDLLVPPTKSLETKHDDSTTAILTVSIPTSDSSEAPCETSTPLPGATAEFAIFQDPFESLSSLSTSDLGISTEGPDVTGIMQGDQDQKPSANSAESNPGDLLQDLQDLTKNSLPVEAALLPPGGAVSDTLLFPHNHSSTDSHNFDLLAPGFHMETVVKEGNTFADVDESSESFIFSQPTSQSDESFAFEQPASQSAGDASYDSPSFEILDVSQSSPGPDLPAVGDSSPVSPQPPSGDSLNVSWELLDVSTPSTQPRSGTDTADETADDPDSLILTLGQSPEHSAEVTPASGDLVFSGEQLLDAPATSNIVDLSWDLLGTEGSGQQMNESES